MYLYLSVFKNNQLGYIFKMKIVNELRVVHKAGRVLCYRTAQSREVLRHFASLHSSG
jgi:hypothetical protein